MTIKNKLIIVFLFMFSIPCYSMDSTAQNINRKSAVALAVRGMQTFDTKNDIEFFAETSPAIPRFFKNKSVLNWQANLSYERLFFNKIPISLGFIGGFQKRSYEWNYTFDMFSTKHNLSKVTDQYVYSKTIPYIGLNLNVGYDYHLNKKVKLQAKAGLNYIKFLKDEHQTLLHRILYQSNDTIFSQVYSFTETLETKSAFYYDLYVGTEINTDSRYIKAYRIGIGFTHRFAFNTYGYVNGTHSLYYNSDGQIVGADQYKNRFRSLFLSLSIVF